MNDEAVAGTEQHDVAGPGTSGAQIDEKGVVRAKGRPHALAGDGQRAQTARLPDHLDREVEVGERDPIE